MAQSQKNKHGETTVSKRLRIGLEPLRVSCPPRAEIFRAAELRESIKVYFEGTETIVRIFPDTLKWETSKEALTQTLRVEGLNEDGRLCVLSTYNPRTRTAVFRRTARRNTKRQVTT